MNRRPGLRIIAGIHKGRRIEPPSEKAVRPTGERVREALFNRLVHGGVAADGGNPIGDAVVLDCFAGSGALALEALSRGAARAILIDRDPSALALARRNASALGELERVETILGDASRLAGAGLANRRRVTLAFLDPPYGQGLAEPCLEALRDGGWLADGATVSIELDARDAFSAPPAFTVVDDRTYGRTRLMLLSFQG